MSIIETIRTALYGSPPSQAYQPSKEGVIDAFDQLVQSVTVISGGVIGSTATIRSSKALLLGVSATDGTLGLVYNDPDTKLNGVYYRLGGAWIFTGLLGVGPEGPGPTSETITAATATAVAATATAVAAAADSEASAVSAATSASVAEAVAGPTYASTALGIAATINGQSFAVDNGDGTITKWRNNAGVAANPLTLATTAALLGVGGAALVGLAQGGNVAGAIRWVYPLLQTSVSLLAAATYAAANDLELRLRGTYTCTTGIEFSGLDSIYLDGVVNFDFTGISNPALVTGRGYVVFNGGALTALPDLLVNAVSGATQVQFASAHGLAVGDWFCVFNPTNFSFSAYKADYWDGQWFRVAELAASNVVKTYQTVLRNYVAVSMDCYKHPGTQIQISGPGKIIIKESQVNNAGLNSKAGFHALRLVDPDLSKVQSTQSDYGSALIQQCIGMHGTGYKCRQSSVREPGYNYGIVIIGCEDMDITGDFNAYNHAVVIGGGLEHGDVPSRYIKVIGNIRNHPTSLIGAANFHGHCEYCEIGGLIDGGVSGGGDYIKVSGVVRWRAGQVGFYADEMRGANIDLSYTHWESLAATAGIFDIGGVGSDALNALMVAPGTIDMRGIVVNAPNATRGVYIRNRGSVQTVHVDLQDARFRMAGGADHFMDVVTGSDFASLNLTGAEMAITGFSIFRNITKVKGWEVNGSAVLTPVIGNPNVGVSITFDTPAFKEPVITMGLSGETVTIGGEICAPMVTNLTSTGATIYAQSTDGSNFTTTAAGKIHYTLRLAT